MNSFLIAKFYGIDFRYFISGGFSIRIVVNYQISNVLLACY